MSTSTVGGRRRELMMARPTVQYCTARIRVRVALGTGLLVLVGITYEIKSKLSQDKTSDRVAILIAWHSVVPILFKDSVILALTF